MRRTLSLLLLSLAATGCSNAPIAGFLDNCFPSHAKSNNDSAPAPPSGVDVRPGAASDPLRLAPRQPPADLNPGPIPPPASVAP